MALTMLVRRQFQCASRERSIAGFIALNLIARAHISSKSTRSRSRRKGLRLPRVEHPIAARLLDVHPDQELRAHEGLMADRKQGICGTFTTMLTELQTQAGDLSEDHQPYVCAAQSTAHVKFEDRLST